MKQSAKEQDDPEKFSESENPEVLSLLPELAEKLSSSQKQEFLVYVEQLLSKGNGRENRSKSGVPASVKKDRRKPATSGKPKKKERIVQVGDSEDEEFEVY